MCKLRELRLEKGLRRDFVAEKLGIVPDHLNRLERGDTPLNLSQIEKMSEIYDLSLGDITQIAIETVKEK